MSLGQKAIKLLIKNSFLLVLILISLNLISQTKERDSLLTKVSKYESEKDFSEKYIDDLVLLSYQFRYKRPDSLKLYATKALRNSKLLDYKKGEASALLRLGDYYSDIGKLNVAVEYFEKAKKIAKSENDFALLVDTYKSEALQQVFSGKSREAVMTYYQGITLAKDHELFEQEGLLRHNLGFFYWLNKLYDDAEKEYLIADSLWILIKDKNHKAATMSNIALNAIDKKDFELAKRYSDMCVATFKEDQPLWFSRAQRVQSRWYLEQRLYDEALLRNLESEKILNTLNNSRDQLEVDILFTRIYLELNDLENATKKSATAFNTAQKVKDINSLLQCYENLEKIERKKSNTAKALFYLEQYKSVKDSLNSKIGNNSIRLAKAKLDFERNQADLLQANQKKLEKQKVIAGTSLGLVSIFMIIIFLIFKNSKSQKKINDELTRLNDSKNRVFSTIGNDLKQPISTLQELLRLYRKKNITAKELKNITPKLKENVDDSAISLNNLLFWAQTQMKTLRVVPEVIYLKEAFNEICSIYQEQIIKKNINIQCSIPKNTIVFVDREHLNIILKNIISNAIKFSNSNKKITFDVLQSLRTTQMLICDKGIGMDKEIVSKILSKENIPSANRTNNEKGTGLGLIICQELLELNKGRLEIESEPNRGSCFYITLPN